MSESVLGEIKKKVFLGTVPVRVQVDTLDIPLCFNVPRAIPLSLFLYHKIEKELGDNCANFLILVNSVDAIQPNIPIGVIYDAFVPSNSKFSPLNVFVNTKNNTIDKNILQCPSEKVASNYFCHSFKESLFLVEGNLSLLQQNINIHLKIQKATLDLNYDAFLPLHEIIVKNVENRQYWPVKVYKKGERVQQCFAKVESGSTQKLSDILKIKNISAEEVTIQGIKVKTEANINDLFSAFIYPDGFLYVVIN